jgi:hypothetical protein
MRVHIVINPRRILELIWESGLMYGLACMMPFTPTIQYWLMSAVGYAVVDTYWELKR